MKCGKKNEYIVIGFSQPSKMCSEHARHALALGKHMGFQVTLTTIDDGTLCECAIKENKNLTPGRQDDYETKTDGD